MVLALEVARDLGAEEALGDRVSGVALQPRGAAVVCFHDDRAAVGAIESANGMPDVTHGLPLILAAAGGSLGAQHGPPAGHWGGPETRNTRVGHTLAMANQRPTKTRCGGAGRFARESGCRQGQVFLLHAGQNSRAGFLNRAPRRVLVGIAEGATERGAIQRLGWRRFGRGAAGCSAARCEPGVVSAAQRERTGSGGVWPLAGQPGRFGMPLRRLRRPRDECAARGWERGRLRLSRAREWRSAVQSW